MDTHGMWHGTKNKQRTRKRVAKIFAKKLPAVSIFLPGEDIMCIKQVHSTGAIRPDMKFILVERKPDVMSKIKEKVKELCPKLYGQCYFHLGELHDLDIKETIHFSFIDLLGNLDRQTFDWFRFAYLPHISANTVTFLTFQKAYRGNNFMRAWRYHTWCADKTMKTLFFRHRETLKTNYPEHTKTFYNRRVPFTIWLLDGLLRETNKFFYYPHISQYKDIKLGTRATRMLFIEIRHKNKPCQVTMPDISTINFDQMQQTFDDYREEKKLPYTPCKISKEEILLEITQTKRLLAGQKAALTRYNHYKTKGDPKTYETAIIDLQNKIANLRKKFDLCD
jgi:hypothetical protein